MLHNLTQREIVKRLAPAMDAQLIPRLHVYYGTTNPNVVRDSARTKVTASQEGADLLRPFFGAIDHREEFWILLLDRGCHIIGAMSISEGGINGTVADPRIIFGAAIMAQASGLVLAHNHPSGQLQPSPDDVHLTKRLFEGAQLLSLQVHDHLILSATGHFSFADHGMLY